MEGEALIIVSLISSIFGLIGLVVYQRGTMMKIYARGDLKQRQYDHMIELQKLKNTHSKALKRLGSTEKGRDIIGALKDVDLSQVKDLLTQVGDIEDLDLGGLGTILQSPLAQGILKGISKRGANAEEGEEFTSQV